VYGAVDDKLDPTNELDVLMDWTMFGILHKMAKGIETNNLIRELIIANISVEVVKNSYIKDLQSDGNKVMYKMFMKENFK
jgi:hypothetical protein